jgi:rare lipoprotein A
MMASWYEDGFITACGQKFDPNDPTTAAHKELRCGTVLRVKGPSGRYLRMVVRDKGPYAKGRSLDVTRAAARELGFLDKGVTTLEVQIVYGP